MGRFGDQMWRLWGGRSARPGGSANSAKALGAPEIRQVGVKRALRIAAERARAQPRVGVARGAAEARMRSIEAGYDCRFRARRGGEDGA